MGRLFSVLLRVIAMDSLGRKRRKTYGDVLCGFVGCRILNPFTGMGYYGLSGRNVERSSLMLHVQLAANHDSVFLELRCLAGFQPSRGTAHVRDAEVFGL